jgi:thiamine-phosphate pyrophosphorylase
LTICLVTDRRRLWPDAPVDVALRSLERQIEAAIAAGVDLVQVRERDLEAADLAALVTEVVHMRQGSRTRVVVNDRVDVALACGADGVHLRHDSLAIDHVRRIAPPGFLVGRSVHRVDDLAGTEAADYLIAGTTFATPSKPAATFFLGLEGLAAIARASRVPILAIGGITMDRLTDVAATGASGIAAIGLFQDATVGATGETAQSLRSRVETIRARFDRPQSPF